MGDAFISLTDINYSNKQIDLTIKTFNQLLKAVQTPAFIQNFNKTAGFYYNIFYELEKYT